jgi:hypothetical protein
VLYVEKKRSKMLSFLTSLAAKRAEVIKLKRPSALTSFMNISKFRLNVESDVFHHLMTFGEVFARDVEYNLHRRMLLATYVSAKNNRRH